MGEVKGLDHIVHPVSKRCTSFSFHINQTNHSWDMSNRMFDLEKTHPKFSKKIWQKKVSNKIPPKSNQVQCKPDISRSCISRNWIYRGRMLDPIFWRPRARYFSRNRGNTLDPIRGRQFFAKSAHRDSLCSRFAGDNFSRNQLWPTCQSRLSMRAGTHAVRSSAKLGWALTPPLYRRVGSG